MRRTLMGSIAMGNANPGPVKQAIYEVVSGHPMAAAPAMRRPRGACARSLRPRVLFGENFKPNRPLVPSG